MIEALEEQPAKPIFGKYEEEAIVALILDHPEYFAHILPHLTDTLFSRLEVRFVIQHILNYHEKFEVFPTRSMLRDMVSKSLTVDDPFVDDILQIVDKKSDPREVPSLRDTIVQWAKHKSYEMLFAQDSIDHFNKGNYEHLDKIVESARRVQEVGSKTLWFFDEMEKIFVEEDAEHFTTGWPILDQYMNDSGPRRKEMCVWMAPTGVGKSIALVNNAIANIRKGCKVLYVTLELSSIASAMRAIGVLTDKAMDTKQKRKLGKETMMKIANQARQDGAGDLVIAELPPDEVSVDSIYALVDELRRNKGWVPDVIVIDYLELLLSRREADNKDQYQRQKSVSTQVRGVAINTNTLVFSATQTNRAGNDGNESIDVTKISESYGKAMPMDYLVSINQTQEEYVEGQEKKSATARFYIAKNRTGKRFITVDIRINYETMRIKEILKP